MTPGQREPDRGMIETCAQPRVDGVAQFALLGKAGRHMIRSIGLLEGALMARVALGRQSLELSDSFTLVAVRAIKPCMPTNERKAVLMFPHPLKTMFHPFTVWHWAQLAPIWRRWMSAWQSAQ